MSCIVGIAEKNGDIVMGADSAGIYGDYQIEVSRRSRKVFRKGNFLFGCGGPFRYMQILQYAFTPSKINEDEDIFRYIVNTFIPEAKKCLEANGWLIHDNGRDVGSCHFLVGHKGRLISVSGDFSIDELIYEYCAVGTGADFAYGSLHTTSKLSIATEQRILMALEAAEVFCREVRRPFTIMKLPYVGGDK